MCPIALSLHIKLVLMLCLQSYSHSYLTAVQLVAVKIAAHAFRDNTAMSRYKDHSFYEERLETDVVSHINFLLKSSYIYPFEKDF